MEDSSFNRTPLDDQSDSISSSVASLPPGPTPATTTSSSSAPPLSPADYQSLPTPELAVTPPPALSPSHPSDSTSSTSTTPPPVPEVPVLPPSDPTDFTAATIFGVCLVGFDHAIGPTVEFSYPPSLNEMGIKATLGEVLPFFALPDGAHARDEDYSYFHLYVPEIATGTIFGISCNRQIQADELINKGKEVTRSTVQKAIVVLASKPIFGPLRDKLGVITRAFFAQKDFGDKTILVDLFTSLAALENGAGADSDREEESKGEAGGMYMGTSLRELVYKFRWKTLTLLKLLMLQRRVMVYGAHTPVELLCTFQYSLVALIPALLTHLEDAATPSLNFRAKRISRPSSLRTSDKRSLIRYLGLPLNIFGKGSFFQPYLPLQQIDMLKTKSYLVGTTNSIFQQQRDCHIDVLVNIETGSVDILNPKLTPLLNLTAADRKWVDELVTTVDNSWNSNDPGRPVGGNFLGSDDFLRAKFEEYVCSMLACIKFAQFLAHSERGDVTISGTGGSEFDANMLGSFNEGFIKAFKATPAFELWNRTTDSVIFDLVEPKHPMEGKTNPIEDVGIRLAHGLHDLHLEENLGPTREAISRGITSGSDSLWKTYLSVRSDLGKRGTEYRERGVVDLAPPPIITNTILTGVDVAKTGAATIATGIGSFLSSSRKSLWSRSPPATEMGGGFFNDRRASSSGEIRYPPTPLKGDVNKGDVTPPNHGPAFLRPLSTSSMASTSAGGGMSASTSNPSLSSAGNFFNSLRRSFTEPTTPPPQPPAPIIRHSPPMRRLGLNIEEDLRVRDLDQEYAEEIARRARADARIIGDDEYFVVGRSTGG